MAKKKRRKTLTRRLALKLKRSLRAARKRRREELAARAHELFGPVQLRRASQEWQDGERLLPSPAATQRVRRLDPLTEREDYRATFSGTTVEFSMWSTDTDKLADAACAAAIEEHGDYARTWTLERIEALNDAAHLALPFAWRGPR